MEENSGVFRQEECLKKGNNTDTGVLNEDIGFHPGKNIKCDDFLNEPEYISSNFDSFNLGETLEDSDSTFESSDYIYSDMNKACADFLNKLIQHSIKQNLKTPEEDATKFPFECQCYNFRNSGQCDCKKTRLDSPTNNIASDNEADNFKPFDDNALPFDFPGFDSVLDTEQIITDFGETFNESDNLNSSKKAEINKTSSIKSNKKYTKIKSVKRRNQFENKHVNLNDENSILFKQKPRKMKDRRLLSFGAVNDCMKWLAGEIMCFIWIVIVMTIKCLVILLIILAFYCLDIGALVWINMKRLLHSEWLNVYVSIFINWKIKFMGKLIKKDESPTKEAEQISMPISGEAAIQRLLSCKVKKNPYSILGASISSTDEEIKKVYRKQAMLVHPDKCQLPGAEEAFKILNNAFEMIGEPENRKRFDSQSTEVKEQEAAMQEFSGLLSKLKTKIEDEMNLMFCTNCSQCHKRILMDRPMHSARYCKKCSTFHPAKNAELWAETSMMGFLWHYYSCMDGKIYDVTEWASCQIDNFKMMQANSHQVLYHISTNGNRNHHIKQDMGVEAVMQKFFNMSSENFKPQDGKPGSSQNSTNLNKKKPRKKKH